MNHVKRTAQTEDDKALKESKTERKKQQTKKDKGDNEERVDDRRTNQDIQESRWTMRSQSGCTNKQRRILEKGEDVAKKSNCSSSFVLAFASSLPVFLPAALYSRALPHVVSN